MSPTSPQPIGGPQNPDRLVVVQDVAAPDIPPGANVMTVVISYPPGDSGAKPHKHSGPCFGYVLEGEMVFELEGSPPRVIKAGEAFWEPGGDIIHYQDGNNREDAWVRFVVTMVCISGQPMLTYVDDDELMARAPRRRA